MPAPWPGFRLPGWPSVLDSLAFRRDSQIQYFAGCRTGYRHRSLPRDGRAASHEHDLGGVPIDAFHLHQRIVASGRIRISPMDCMLFNCDRLLGVRGRRRPSSGRGYIDHHGTGSDKNFTPYRHVLNHDCAGTNMGRFANRYPAGNDGAGRNMHVIVNTDIVIHDCSKLMIKSRPIFAPGCTTAPAIISRPLRKLYPLRQCRGWITDANEKHDRKAIKDIASG